MRPSRANGELARPRRRGAPASVARRARARPPGARGPRRRRDAQPPSAASAPVAPSVSDGVHASSVADPHAQPKAPACHGAPCRDPPASRTTKRRGEKTSRRRASSRPCRRSPWPPRGPSAGRGAALRRERARSSGVNTRASKRGWLAPGPGLGVAEVDHVIAEHRSHCSSSSASAPRICCVMSSEPRMPACSRLRLERSATRQRKRSPRAGTSLKPFWRSPRR